MADVVIRPDDGDPIANPVNGASALAADDPHGIADVECVGHGVVSFRVVCGGPACAGPVLLGSGAIGADATVDGLRADTGEEPAADVNAP